MSSDKKVLWGVGLSFALVIAVATWFLGYTNAMLMAVTSDGVPVKVEVSYWTLDDRALDNEYKVVAETIAAHTSTDIYLRPNDVINRILWKGVAPFSLKVAVDWAVQPMFKSVSVDAYTRDGNNAHVKAKFVSLDDFAESHEREVVMLAVAQFNAVDIYKSDSPLRALIEKNGFTTGALSIELSPDFTERMRELKAASGLVIKSQAELQRALDRAAHQNDAEIARLKAELAQAQARAHQQ